LSGLLARRLHNQYLTGPGLTRPEDVVRLLGAVQSQDYPGAKWSIGMRLKRGTDALVDRAFSEGRFLRTHVLRPTWHFVLPEDIRWMLELTSPHIRRMNSYVARRFAVDGPLCRRALRTIAKALEGGRHHTRADIAALLGRAGIKASGIRLAYIVMEAELTGLVCSGAMRGKQQTYALLDERAPGARTLPRDEALAQLALRFFQGHSPATLRHFVWWSNLKVSEAKRGLADVESRLESEVIDGTTWYSVARRASFRRTSSAHLVPEYDEALVGSRDMGTLDLVTRIPGRPTEAFLKPIVIGDRSAGVWRRLVGPRSVTIEIWPLGRLSARHTAMIERAAARYGKVLGRPVSVRSVRR
jgi:hypothetical protein